jgi:glycosyltransferase involved in cell wall biosynthesis
MRILIVSYYFPPLNAGACQRPYSWAKYWSRAGHQVSVLTVARKLRGPDFAPAPFDGFEVIPVTTVNLYQGLRDLAIGGGRGRKPPVGKRTALSAAQLPGRWLNRWLMHTGVFFYRLPSLIDLWIMPAASWAARNGRWDLVISSFGPYANHLVAWQLKRRFPETTWIADFRDLWTAGHPYYGQYPFTILEKRLEQKVIADADMITTVSQPLAVVLDREYPGKDIRVVENGFEPDDLSGIPQQPIFPPDGMVRLIYTGSLYRGKRDPSPLFQAIANVDRGPERNLLDSLEVVFAGLDPADLQRLIEEYGVGKWVRYAGYVDRARALAMQRDAHALIFLDWDDPQVDGIITGKLFEYLFSGTAVWVVGNTGDTAAKRLVREFNSGLILDNDVNRIEQSLLGLLTNPAKQRTEPSKTLRERYSRKSLAMRLLE